jgi:hypothetical protein
MPTEKFSFSDVAQQPFRADEGIQSAYKTLRPAADRITDSLTILFNLGCYSCALGRLDEARTWLEKTFKEAVNTDFDGFYQRLAADDLHLKELWPEIPHLGENEFVKLFFNDRNY